MLQGMVYCWAPLKSVNSHQSRSINQTFDYMISVVDFSHSMSWDLGVVETNVIKIEPNVDPIMFWVNGLLV
jgi:hypothetical protein